MLLKKGDKIKIVGEHPWAGETGTLMEFGSYGLSFLNLKGWKIKLDNNHECYCHPDLIRRV